MLPVGRAQARAKAKYACCKHGPGHEWVRRPSRDQEPERCGYSHDLGQLELPSPCLEWQWQDTTHEYRGHAGIDLFLGQKYMPQQMERVIALLANEGILANLWAAQLSWFLGIGGTGPYSDLADCGWPHRVRHYSEKLFPPGYIVGNVLADEDIPYPFTLMRDEEGLTLPERMRMRMESVKKYSLYTALLDWDDYTEVYNTTIANRRWHIIS